MYKKQTGFTIVELLIVIVVIGILAAITVVAYNGVQQKSQNAKTSQALASWIKSLQMYKTESGRWPGVAVCLGQGYLYGPSGADTTGTAQCRQSNLTGYTESTAFNGLMKPYIGATLPTPSFVTAKSTDDNWRRGLSYLYGGGGSGTQVYIDAVYAGAPSVCPTVGGIDGTRNVWGGNVYCNYVLGATTDT